MRKTTERQLAQEGDQRLVRPDGLSVRRRRHARSWSPREFIAAIARANWRAHGLRDTITPRELSDIEERDTSVAWATLRLLADGLDCDPVDLLRDSDSASPRAATLARESGQQSRRESSQKSGRQTAPRHEANARRIR